MRKYLRLSILLISLSTVLCGIIQLILPAFVSGKIGLASHAVSLQLLATLGLFMFLFGAMSIHALYTVHTSKVVIFWAAFQKIGASIAVGIGIFHGIFNSMAAWVALFDLLSGCLFFYYYTCLLYDETY